MRLITVISVCCLAVSVAADAQSAVRTSRPGRWTIAVYLGSSSGGPSRDLEAAMASAGYTTPFGGCDFFCMPESPSPNAYSHANPWLLSVRYQVRGAYGTELLVGQSAAGIVTGRRESEILNVDYGGTLIAPLASVGSRQLQLGVGPALLRGHWTYHNTSDGSRSRESSNTLGWLAASTVALPISSTFQLQGTGQYRGFGDARVRGARITGAHWYFAGGVGVSM